MSIAQLRTSLRRYFEKTGNAVTLMIDAATTNETLPLVRAILLADGERVSRDCFDDGGWTIDVLRGSAETFEEEIAKGLHHHVIRRLAAVTYFHGDRSRSDCLSRMAADRLLTSPPASGAMLEGLLNQTIDLLREFLAMNGDEPGSALVVAALLRSATDYYLASRRQWAPCVRDLPDALNNCASHEGELLSGLIRRSPSELCENPDLIFEMLATVFAGERMQRLVSVARRRRLSRKLTLPERRRQQAMRTYKQLAGVPSLVTTDSSQ